MIKEQAGVGIGGGDGGVVSPHNNANDDSDEDEDEDEDDEQEGAVPRVVFTTVSAAENIVKEIMKKELEGGKACVDPALDFESSCCRSCKNARVQIKKSYQPRRWRYD